MDVADSVGVAADDVAVVACAVLDVSGVEAQRDGLRIGVVEKLVDEQLRVDVGSSIVRKPDSTTSSRNVDQCGCVGSSGNQIPHESGAVPRCRRG